ncbi:MAG: nucleotidyltransferase domain-containing protein [Clostridia bacterium]|nr:nucleotidyltransferase domain-containing protein [Clostridia bacterium]
MYGLLERDMDFIIKAVRKYEVVEAVILFGSRAMGNYKQGSDVDLAILGENVTRSVTRGISEALNEEYPLPYFFDVLCYRDISSDRLKEHIDKEGVVLYKKDVTHGQK